MIPLKTKPELVKLRLHEIELGSDNLPQNTTFFQTVLGLKPSVQQKGLTVFESGLQGLDFNLSTHFSPGVCCISFLTDDLREAEERLKAAGIVYDGPSPSHLGMNSIQFKSPDGCLIRINEATASSPDWLKV